MRPERLPSPPNSSNPLDRLPARLPYSGVDVLRAAPAIARVALGSLTSAASWGFRKTRDTGSRVVTRALDGDSPQDILADLSTDAIAELRSILGFAGAAQVITTESYAVRDAEQLRTADLRARGAELLRRSADVNADDDGHPAYERILSELAPDEARILRFLYLEGPQPSIDVRTGRPLGIGSELVEGGLNMIGEHSGLAHAERIHPYLTNLNRLGMVGFSKESVSNPTRYQLVEAQPHMAEVMQRAGFAAKAVQRSILLTPFGRDFVEACLPVEKRTVE